MADFVAAIDQGTTSTRCMIFDHSGAEVSRAQQEHEQILPRAGWVEHDALEIWERTQTVVAEAFESLDADPSAVAALGITNQRETTVVWDPKTGQPYHNAIVWQDTRTADFAAELRADERGTLIKDRTGLPPATYFAGGKLHWLLENVDGLRDKAENGEALFGTIDTWLLWNLTGGPDGGVHRTDVTNAGRTMLMDLAKLAWDDDLLEIFGVPRAMLPEIRPSSDPNLFGRTKINTSKINTSKINDLDLAIGGVLGDQHAAMVGQVCLSPGDAKNTYGTGNFLLLNTGTDIVRSEHGLLSTVCYQFGDQPAHYALEGSIAVTGSAIQWLRDQLGIISHASEADDLANSVEDAAGCYFVPAFSGLFAPYWRSDARGVIVGLARFHTKAHLARATLEAICYQSVDVVEAMRQDSGIEFSSLKVDGGVTASGLTMQLQADTVGLEVIKPKVAETTALGAAYAAGLAVGFWSSPDEFTANWQEDRRWSPTTDADARAAAMTGWHKAIDRTLDWAD